MNSKTRQCLYLFYIYTPLQLNISQCLVAIATSKPILEGNEERLISLEWASLAHERRQWLYSFKPSTFVRMINAWLHWGSMWWNHHHFSHHRHLRSLEEALVLKARGCRGWGGGQRLVGTTDSGGSGFTLENKSSAFSSHTLIAKLLKDGVWPCFPH